ncbi:SGNH/GDSL hydrolase family protein [Pararhizobium sp. IMCC21322]|uniref:SGNH/GDSL hydrolase family protein n=1 Tax=Pararhizobium sp. IMCC21322 TaxID=3067903 RepID=UPI00274189DD|nr:SGNH/GDSL hydrolase family protein [Pararhizobium sp. IMCC21322]
MKIRSQFIIIAINSLILLLIIEASSHVYMRYIGDKKPFFLNIGSINGEGDDVLNALDPLLGYAHGYNEDGVINLNENYTWHHGFVIYKKLEDPILRIDEIERPIILTLGGSTTDGISYGHSWPEELAKNLKSLEIKGTVINGGTGGYSTNQELLKLIRDGLEFHPDIVISYSGINDRGRYSELPQPMTHKFQRKMFGKIVNKQLPIIMPSFVALISSFSENRKVNKLSLTLGVESEKSLPEQFEKNIQIMKSVSGTFGADFVSFIQPYKYYRNDFDVEAKEFSEFGKNRKKYINDVNLLYKNITKLADKYDYMYNSTDILNDYMNVYKKDGTHLLPKGDKIVSEYIFETIKPMLSKL